MFLTVTLNPSIDKYAITPSLRANSLNRIRPFRIEAGGKGINVSKALSSFSVPATALGLLGDENADLFYKYLKETDISHRFIPVPGTTRTNLKVISSDTGEVTELNELGFSVSGTVLNAFLSLVDSLLPTMDGIVLSGSLPDRCPSSYYKDIVNLAVSYGKPVVLDADGEAFREAVSARPTMIKPNKDELSRYTGKTLDTLDDIICAAKELHDSGICTVVVSMGADGAVCISDEGVFRAEVPKSDILSPIASGDTMVAAMLYAYHHGFDTKKLLSFAVAAGTATAMQSGSAVCTLEDAVQLEQKIHCTHLI